MMAVSLAGCHCDATGGCLAPVVGWKKGKGFGKGLPEIVSR